MESSLFLSLGSLIIGIVATVLISHYYFRRSLGKALTPYVQFFSSPLRDIDPNVRAELEIRYQGRAIDDLFEVQFLIANTGDKAIRDVIEPLTLTLPDESALLDASLLHVKPDGRKVDILRAEDSKKIVFDFPLLNSQEFFIVKLLLNGRPKASEFRFAITADELPPNLKAVPLPYDALATSTKSPIEYSGFVVGAICLVLGFAISSLIYQEWPSLPAFSLSHPWTFFIDLGWNGWSVLISALPGLFLLVIGVIIPLVVLVGGVFPPPKRKFIVPEDKRELLRHRFMLPPYISNEMMVEEVRLHTDKPQTQV